MAEPNSAGTWFAVGFRSDWEQDSPGRNDVVLQCSRRRISLLPFALPSGLQSDRRQAIRFEPTPKGFGVGVVVAVPRRLIPDRPCGG